MIEVEEFSPWAYLVRRPPTSKILDYLLVQWQEYERIYSGKEEPFGTRSEPELTEGLGAFLTKKYDNNSQPFDGEFFAELVRVDLGPDGKRRIIGRSDIEWRLHGQPNFVIEFKVIGGGRPAKDYVTKGIVRFVEGRYGQRSLEGAMWAFFRPGFSKLRNELKSIIDTHRDDLRCQVEDGCYQIVPSKIAPATAEFDSIHDRSPDAPTIRLAHIFVNIS